MRKLLIIDDEYLVRIGIKETIEWEKYDIEIVGEAVNGKKGLEKTLELKPDIVISDVRMPIMDGLEYIKAVKEKELDIAIITLSGYKDFEYAKEALVNGADQYLLKPIDNNELIKAVLSSLEKLEERRKNKQKIKSFEHDQDLITNAIILDILQNEYSNGIIQDKIKSYNLNISSNGLLAYIKLDNNNQNLLKDLNNIAENIKIIFNENNISYFGCKEENSVLFLINTNNQEFVSSLLSDYIDESKIENNTISGYLSNPYKELNELSKVYKKAKKAVKNKLFLTINTFITLNDNNEQKLHKTVVLGLSYIKENYKKDISIKTCAESLYVSESHLMHMFKDILGKTFNECLTEYRMFKAKNLLSTNKYKVYEVSYMVGYNDTKYFSQVFKKINGISPNDFLNNNYED